MKYTVIIPVYNAEKTLHRCLDSLSGQSFSDAEFLLVDDGSTDSSRNICLEYAHRDCRFRVLPKANGGVSTARNMGLDAAKGEFILFVDSDDYVEPDYFTQLEDLDAPGLYDYLLFSYIRFCGSTRTERVLPDFSSRSESEYAPLLAQAYCTKRINAPWNKRYRRSILLEHRIRFHEDLPIAEDTLFNLNYLLCIRSYRTCGAKLYNVSLENPNSLSRKNLADRKALLALADREAENAIRTAAIGEDFRRELLRARNFLELSDIYSAGKQLHLSGVSLPERWQTLGGLCREYARRNPDLPNNRRFRLLAVPVLLRASPLIDMMSFFLARR